MFWGLLTSAGSLSSHPVSLTPPKQDGEDNQMEKRDKLAGQEKSSFLNKGGEKVNKETRGAKAVTANRLTPKKP